MYCVQGDSGGPLYMAEVEQTGAKKGQVKQEGGHPWYLMGLVSFGSRECAAGKPAIYTRVESFLPWIR